MKKYFRDHKNIVHTLRSYPYSLQYLLYRTMHTYNIIHIKIYKRIYIFLIFIDSASLNCNCLFELAMKYLVEELLIKTLSQCFSFSNSIRRDLVRLDSITITITISITITSCVCAVFQFRSCPMWLSSNRNLDSLILTFGTRSSVLGAACETYRYDGNFLSSLIDGSC